MRNHIERCCEKKNDDIKKTMKHNTNPISPQSPKSSPPGLYKKHINIKWYVPPMINICRTAFLSSSGTGVARPRPTVSCVHNEACKTPYTLPDCGHQLRDIPSMYPPSVPLPSYRQSASTIARPSLRSSIQTEK
ncbi:hypothetical protein BO85DRAFT_101915 [Aspergillus piperis CBS 112811]|uniref:Uncharacterized protein n=1 Tax=Aspergillus piperis CBS 112811 TaxID=1448313 RepID=A0A8G1VLL3_9EURO|nr:hypothetical protein BO85DRAFT_101915 [Aspergillus piperis CBS 112811]RAH54833.1 hypothetical protein BO85DRAFT_101915 [Aspergillus piperis CBS 112811]